MIRHIPQSSFVKGTWRNGRGVSWDIASDQAFGATEFGWRFAMAEIAATGPFSHYEGVDRVFTLLEGEGVDLRFGDGASLTVHQRCVPHHFACDIATHCTLRGGTSKALNLFTNRHMFIASAVVIDVRGMASAPEGASLFYVLHGEVQCEGITLAQGDAAQIKSREAYSVTGTGAKLYVARLKALSP